MAELEEAIVGVDGVVGGEGFVVGPGVHVLTDAVVVDDACDFEGDGHFATGAVDDVPVSGEEFSKAGVAAFEVGEVGGLEDLLPELLEFWAGTIGVESGGDGVCGAVEDEGFAELEPVGEVVAEFCWGGHGFVFCVFLLW